jgi:hypothetical protein
LADSCRVSARASQACSIGTLTLQQPDCSMSLYLTMWPNKSPEPTPVTPALLSGSRRLADVIRPAWLSFGR